MSSDAPIGWVAAFVGAYFVYAAITDRNPVSALTAVITDSPSSVKPIGSMPAGSLSQTNAGANGAPGGGSSFAPVATASPADTAAATAIANGTAPLRLVAIAGGMSLAAPAATAYGRASSMFGQPIPITSGYRSFERQAAAYAKDQERFAPPDKSLHVKGLAIDIDSSRAKYNDPKLVSALTRSGWAQVGSDVLHWSFGIRG